MFLLRIALKNTFRKMRRSLLTAVSIFVGVFMMVLGLSFIDGLDSSVIRGQIRSDTGHFRIMAKGYLEAEEENEIGPLVEEWEKQKASWGDSMEAQLHPRLSFPAELSNGRDGLQARGVGIEPESYLAAFELPVIRSAPVKPEQNPVWVGSGLAEPLGLEPGSTATLLARTRFGTYTAEEFVVAGIIRSSNAAVDSTTFFIPLKKAQELLDSAHSVSEVVGFVPRDALALEVQSRHASTLQAQGLFMQTWQERAAPVLSVNQVRRKSLNALVFLIMLVAATSIANTMVMSAFERIREIGTYRALGLQTERMAAMLMVEAGVIGVLGALMGALLGSAAIYSMRSGIDMSSMASSGNITVSMSTMLYVDLSPARVVSSFMTGLIVAALAALYPAIKFSRLSPMEAMKR
ncbi:FtsX-like permease family protein [Stigmatella sp. ncwal1]|uniref:FtsX-like permease family protein n=1 Tax=Stigmatella ashevillensis TaxID=2995309 RepID=A0ABT5D4G2_9BACT|nr:FtsX-like permease family protein [Stigmatella ashevillena]MDC0708559.1 FtsX-like permease family protein [Stigmatella ashevillena]